MAIYNITSKEEFEKKVTNSKNTILVDFWAQWCAPCRMMSPLLEEAAKKFDGKVDIIKVNIEESEENQQLAAEHGVQGIPNMQVYRNGTVIETIIGMVPAPVLDDTLSKHSA